jgi:hypothetical protein
MTRPETAEEMGGLLTSWYRRPTSSNLATGNASMQLEEIQGVVCVKYRYRVHGY